MAEAAELKFSGLGEPAENFVMGNHRFEFLRGSYQEILRQLVSGASLLSPSDLKSTVLLAALSRHQGPDVWSFVDFGPERLSKRGWALAVRPTSSGFVQHERSPNSSSPFCGAWVVTNTKNNS